MEDGRHGKMVPQVGYLKGNNQRNSMYTRIAGSLYLRIQT